jgi:hypothetical protein
LGVVQLSSLGAKGMRRLFQKRWVWFLLGMASLPTLIFVADLFLRSPNPKAEMPFTSIFEESRTETYFPADYSYSLRSKGTMDEFRQFVRKMRMEAYRVSDTRYERKEREHVTVISYEDGWIAYHEDQS